MVPEAAKDIKDDKLRLVTQTSIIMKPRLVTQTSIILKLRLVFTQTSLIMKLRLATQNSIIMKLRLDVILCLSGREMAPTRQRALLNDTLGARNEDYVGGATC